MYITREAEKVGGEQKFHLVKTILRLILITPIHFVIFIYFFKNQFLFNCDD